MNSAMHRKLLPILWAAPVVMAQIVFAAEGVRLSDTGEEAVRPARDDRVGWVRRTLRLESGNAVFALRYDRYKTPDGAWGGSPHEAAVHLNHPYDGPFFSFNARDGARRSLDRRPFEVETHTAGTDRKGVVFSWEADGAHAELTTAVHAGEPALYGRLRLTGGTPPWSMHMNLHPAGFCPRPEDRDRRVLLPAKDTSHGPARHALAEAGWLLLYDRKLDPALHAGKGALGFVWYVPEAATANFQCGEYSASFEARWNTVAATFYFQIRAFPMIPNAEAKERMRAFGEAYAASLVTQRDRLYRTRSRATIRPPVTP